MPNWCSNQLVIHTDVSPDEFLIKHGDEYRLSFEKVVPLGEWDYDKSIANWGVKWDLGIDDSTVNITPYESGQDEYRIYYDTAWTYPEGFLKTLYDKLLETDDNTHVVNTYYEPGCDLMGRWENGLDMSESFEGDYIEELGMKVVYDTDAYDFLSEFEECIMVGPAKEELKRLFNDNNITRKEYRELLDIITK